MTANDALMKDVLGWDVRTWSAAVEFWERALPPTATPLRCLEIGAGPGGPSLWLALRGHTVVCSNLANTAAMASPLHHEYGVSAQIEYRDIDVTAVPYENHFDVVIFKSVLGGVGSLQGEAMAQILRSLKPGGLLLFAENIRGTIFHRLARAIAYRLRGTSWHYLSLAQMTSLLSGFSSVEIHTTGVFALFGNTESRRRKLASFDRHVANRLVPRSWKYVSYGSATK
ncbi:class I SAM-dependent methyltransferase [Salinibacterium sp.]|uniref:class I SAM-dependent methyltransferase n=1 Tax=Salinibacterium sp. TaxID=1915057 RepID=UPI00286B5159|nr:class I SAM-dependent methyltransferase [Salinibacterium sp.]